MSHPFQTMDEIVNKFFAQPAFAKLAYCDYIAHLISKELKANDHERLLSSVSRPKFDITPEGKFASTKKTIEIEDRFGTKYRVTVEKVK
jgi:hypothetical protein